MAEPFHANLVIAELAEYISVSGRNEVIEIVSAATGSKRQHALLGNDIIELEFTNFEVLTEIIQHRPCFMARRTAQAVLTRERGKGGGVAGERKKKACS